MDDWYVCLQLRWFLYLVTTTNLIHANMDCPDSQGRDNHELCIEGCNHSICIGHEGCECEGCDSCCHDIATCCDNYHDHLIICCWWSGQDSSSGSMATVTSPIAVPSMTRPNYGTNVSSSGLHHMKSQQQAPQTSPRREEKAKNASAEASSLLEAPSPQSYSTNYY